MPQLALRCYSPGSLDTWAIRDWGDMGQFMGLWGSICCFLAPLLALTPTAPAQAENEPRRNAILYEIRSPETQALSYLFGTIHSEDPRVLSLPAPVRAAFEASTSFALEVIPDGDSIIRSMVTMTYTDGRTLREVLPDDLYEQSAVALHRLGMPTAAFRDFKPWAVVTLISVPPAETGDFLDMRLYREALAASKRIEGLESIEEQLAIFDAFTESDQIALLRETLDALDELPKIFEALINAYLARDLDALMALGDSYLDHGDPRLAELFRQVAVVSRNHRMATRMTPLLNEGGWFIAVGALHLPSVSGILRLLDQQGFQVTPVY